MRRTKSCRKCINTYNGQKRRRKRFGPYDRQPRNNLHTAISANKPKLSATKHDQTLILAHMYDTSRYTANTKMYSGILHTHTHTHARTHARTHTHRWGGGGGGGGWGGIKYIQIWRDEFLRLAWNKMLILSDEYHTVANSTVSGPWKEKLLSKGLCFRENWKVCGRFWCQKWSEVVWMDGRQSGVQKDRLGNFQ